MRELLFVTSYYSGNGIAHSEIDTSHTAFLSYNQYMEQLYLNAWYQIRYTNCSNSIEVTYDEYSIHV